MKEVTCFDDLEFGQHPNRREGCVSAVHELPNGLTISVVGGPGLYGDGIESFEIACWETESRKWLKLSEHDDVIGWCSKGQIEGTIQRLLNVNLG
jgi:hypothetical protein